MTILILTLLNYNLPLLTDIKQKIPTQTINQMHFEEKDKNDDNDDAILSTRRMVDDEISSNEEKRVKRENF